MAERGDRVDGGMKGTESHPSMGKLGAVEVRTYVIDDVELAVSGPRGLWCRVSGLREIP